VIIQALEQMEDHYPYTRGMIAQCGFKSVGIDYRHLKRERGEAKGKFYVLIDMGLNGLISFTNVPLRVCMLAGLVIAALSLLFVFVQLFLLLFVSRGASPPGIPTLIIALFFFSGSSSFSWDSWGIYQRHSFSGSQEAARHRKGTD